jgi:hypothetical protein
MAGGVWEAMSNSYDDYPNRSDVVVEGSSADDGHVLWCGGHQGFAHLYHHLVIFSADTGRNSLITITNIHLDCKRLLHNAQKTGDLWFR